VYIYKQVDVENKVKVLIDKITLHCLFDINYEALCGVVNVKSIKQCNVILSISRASTPDIQVSKTRASSHCISACNQHYI